MIITNSLNSNFLINILFFSEKILFMSVLDIIFYLFLLTMKINVSINVHPFLYQICPFAQITKTLIVLYILWWNHQIKRKWTCYHYVQKLVKHWNTLAKNPLIINCKHYAGTKYLVRIKTENQDKNLDPKFRRNFELKFSDFIKTSPRYYGFLLFGLITVLTDSDRLANISIRC